MEGDVHEAITVKVAVAVLVPSVALTVCAPTDALGTVKVQLPGILPPLLVTQGLGLVVTVVLSNLMVSVELPAKGPPLPPPLVTATLVPAGPVVGLTEIVASVKSQVVEPEITP